MGILIKLRTYSITSVLFPSFGLKHTFCFFIFRYYPAVKVCLVESFIYEQIFRQAELSETSSFNSHVSSRVCQVGKEHVVILGVWPCSVSSRPWNKLITFLKIYDILSDSDLVQIFLHLNQNVSLFGEGRVKDHTNLFEIQILVKVNGSVRWFSVNYRSSMVQECFNLALIGKMKCKITFLVGYFEIWMS